MILSFALAQDKFGNLQRLTRLIEIRHKPVRDLPLADALSRSHISETSRNFAIEQCTSCNLSRIFVNHLFITNKAILKIQEVLLLASSQILTISEVGMQQSYVRWDFPQDYGGTNYNKRFATRALRYSITSSNLGLKLRTYQSTQHISQRSSLHRGQSIITSVVSGLGSY